MKFSIWKIFSFETTPNPMKYQVQMQREALKLQRAQLKYTKPVDHSTNNYNCTIGVPMLAAIGATASPAINPDDIPTAERAAEYLTNILSIAPELSARIMALLDQFYKDKSRT